MKDEYNAERMGKIVEIAKHGIGGEKTNALDIIRRLCKKHNLNFDDVMSAGATEYEYTLYYKTKEEKSLLVQVIIKFAYGGDGSSHSIFENNYRKVVIFKATQEQYFECLNAWEVLLRLYKKEKRKIANAVFYGFLSAHELYSNGKPGEEVKLSKAEEDARRTGAMLSHGMEEANINKRLGAGK